LLLTAHYDYALLTAIYYLLQLEETYGLSATEIVPRLSLIPQENHAGALRWSLALEFLHVGEIEAEGQDASEIPWDEHGCPSAPIPDMIKIMRHATWT